MQKTELSGALDRVGVRKGTVAVVCLSVLIVLLAGAILIAPGTVAANGPTPRIYLPIIEKGYSEYEIAFFSNRQATKDKYTDVFLMDSGGNNQHSLVDTPSYQPAARDDKFEWRPDGSMILYTRLFEGSNSYTDLFVAKADGTGTINLTDSGAPVSEYAPTWSDDGSEIAFVSNKDSGWEIYKIDYTGAAVSPASWNRLTNNSANEWGPQWSPDGSKIAYLSTEDTGSLQVWIMNPNGSSKTRLTNDFWSSGTFCWNPDGDEIAYDYTDDGEYRVFVVSAVLNSPTPSPSHLTGYDCWGPSWSPDGDTIAYHKWLGFVEIYSIPSDSTNGANEKRLTYDYHETRFPSWSPDSEYITYSQNHHQTGHYWEIYTMHADGSAHTRLTTHSAEDKFPAFSPVKK